MALLLCAGNVSGAFIATLTGPSGEAVILVPVEGGTYDLAVNLSRGATDGGSGISGVQMDFTAASDATFTAELVGVQGGSAGLDGTGTRYNSVEWDSDILDGFALDPDVAAGPLGSTPRGPFGSGHLDLWTTTSSLLGYIRVIIGPLPPGQEVHVAPVNVLGFPDFVSQEDDVLGEGVGITFRGVPEPATWLLMTGFLLTLIMRRARPAVI